MKIKQQLQTALKKKLNGSLKPSGDKTRTPNILKSGIAYSAQ